MLLPYTSYKRNVYVQIHGKHLILVKDLYPQLMLTVRLVTKTEKLHWLPYFHCKNNLLFLGNKYKKNSDGIFNIITTTTKQNTNRKRSKNLLKGHKIFHNNNKTIILTFYVHTLEKNPNVLKKTIIVLKSSTYNFISKDIKPFVRTAQQQMQYRLSGKQWKINRIFKNLPLMFHSAKSFDWVNIHNGFQNIMWE